MSMFDILAEAKIRQWEQDVKDGKVKNTPIGAPSLLDASQSLEKILYDEIRHTIIKSYKATGDARTKMLQASYEMQVQLASRLEKSGYYVMSKMFADEIQKVRIKASTACHDAALLAAMLDELD